MAEIQKPTPATTDIVSSLASSLRKEATDTPIPSLERCNDVLKLIESHEKMPIMVLKQSQIGKVLSRSIKSFKRHNRTSSSSSNDDWSPLIKKAENILQRWKDASNKEREEFQEKKRKRLQTDFKGSLPESQEVYKSRLLRQRKELYKDPPVLPPPSISINPKAFPPPTRHPQTHQLTFTGPPSIKPLLSSFHPNLTPEDIVRGGSFGGTYFRPISSAVTNMTYNNPHDVLSTTVAPEWISGLNVSKTLASPTYDVRVNKYRVKCGGSLGMWESSGWITDCDPYGWFQWYCRFYKGRRCDDDERQIKRWAKCAGEKGRFLSQLCNKILKAGGTAKVQDESISPVIRQTLWHWGVEVDQFILERHRKRIGG